MQRLATVTIFGDFNTCTGLKGRNYITQDMLEEKKAGLAVICHAGPSFFEAESSVGHVPDSLPSFLFG